MLAGVAVRALMDHGPRRRRWRQLAGRPGAEAHSGLGRRIAARFSGRKLSGDIPPSKSTLLSWIGFAAAGGVAASLLLGSAVGLLPGAALALAISRGQARRRAADQAARFNEVFPDALVRMAGHLRAGQSLAQAVEAVATFGSGPLERCLGRVLADYRAGVPLIQALRRLEGEFPGQATGQLQQVLDVYRLSGGDLAGVLDSAAAALAEHHNLHGELEAKTAEVRLSARILLALPLALGAYFWFASPEMLRPLWETPTGRIGSIYGTASWLIGREVINRLIAEVQAERG